MADMPLHDEIRYEKSDVSVRGIIWSVVVFVAIGIVLSLAMVGLYGVYVAYERSVNPALPAAVARERPHLPADVAAIPAPRLETKEIEDILQLRADEAKWLDEYGWANEKDGTVRMPINEALRLLGDPKVAARYGIRVRKEKP